MRETFEPEIVIEGISYETFYALLEFLYTGKLKLTEAQLNDVCFLMGLLRAADQFCVDCVKQMCEKHLSSLVDNENVEGLLQEAERFQAHQLRQHCEWFRRQEQFTGDEDDGQMGVPPGCGLAEPSPIVCMAELASSSAQQPCTPAAPPEGEAPKTDSTWLGEALYEATMEVDPSNAPEFGKGQGDV